MATEGVVPLGPSRDGWAFERQEERLTTQLLDADEHFDHDPSRYLRRSRARPVAATTIERGGEMDSYVLVALIRSYCIRRISGQKLDPLTRYQYH